MGLAHSPSVVTNGLVFYYDMNNKKKSYAGEPTTNQFAIPTPDGNGNVSFAVNGTGTFQRVFSGTFGNYDIKPTDIVYRYDLGTNGCHYHGNDVTITSGLYPTFTFDYYLSPDVSSFGDTFMANFENLGSGVSGSAALPNLQKGVWQTIQINGNAATSTSGLRMLLYPGGCSGGRLAATGYILMKNPQVTFSSTSGKVLPFVAGTRYANSNLESTPSYPSWNQTAGSSASGGTLTFSEGSYNSKGSWDLYKTYSGLSTGTNYTWSALVKLGTASNLIITMNNTQAWNTGPSTVVAGLSSTDWTRVTITGTTNSGSFNLHLGASFNTEVASTSQSAGTVFIQDVRLVLSQSQTAISDLMDQNSSSAQNMVYNSDGTFQFSYANPSYIQVPNSVLNKSEGTMNFWVYPTRYNGGNGYFVNREDATANAIDWFWIGPYSDTFYFRIGNGSDCCSNDLAFGSVSSVIPINTWTNMCFTWKANGTSEIYKNGILYTSRNIGNIPSTHPANNGRIGLGHVNADNYYDGKMPLVQIYNRQLSAAEILQNFNSSRVRYGL